MNMPIKKKEIAAAALVVLIGCAGYLNWSYQDTMKVRDGESYIETGRKLGEAQLVNSEVELADSADEEQSEQTGREEEETEKTLSDEGEEVKDAEYFEEAKFERENARSKAMEILDQTCSNSSFDDETRRKAGDKLVEMTQNIESEQEIESIARSKGYDEVCAYVSGSSVTITVKHNGFDSDDALKLSEIAQEQTDIEADKIRIVNVDK